MGIYAGKVPPLPPLRLMRVSIPYETMLSIMRGRIRLADEFRLPDDAIVHEAHDEWRTRSIDFVVESASFEIVPEGEMIPAFPPLILTMR